MAGILDSILKQLVVHKWRRAPFGSGKFWRSLQESLEVVLDNCHSSHPVFDFLYDSICADVDSEVVTHSQAWKILRSTKGAPLGPKVQMRRWFTIWDAGWSLDELWHSMLYGLVTTYAMDNIDAFKLACEVVPIIQKGDSKEAHQYKFKQQVLLILMDSVNQKLLRSMLHIFKRLRNHQSDYTRDATNPQECLKFSLMWSNINVWLDQVVVPSMKDALCDLNVMARLGFTDDIPQTTAPLMTPTEVEGDDGSILLQHTRLAMELLWQSLVYASQPMTPPGPFADSLTPAMK